MDWGHTHGHGDHNIESTQNPCPRCLQHMLCPRATPPGAWPLLAIQIGRTGCKSMCGISFVRKPELQSTVSKCIEDSDLRQNYSVYLFSCHAQIIGSEDFCVLRLLGIANSCKTLVSDGISIGSSPMSSEGVANPSKAKAKQE